MGNCWGSNQGSKYAIDNQDEKELEKLAQKGTKAKRRRAPEAKEITARPKKALAAKQQGDGNAGSPTPAPPNQQKPDADAAADSHEARNGHKPPAPAPAPKPRLNIKDFQFKQCKGEVKVKAPGTINGQAFMIDECVDCDLYVLDRCAAVTIDDSRNCRIFIGPTDGSIFMRNCTNVKCCFIGRQIRLRDVTNSNVALLCRTKPIIETSTNVGVMCYDLWYPALPDQLQATKLDTFHNFWDSIHDFTPKPDSWRYLEPELTVSEMMGPIPEEVQTAMGEAKHGQIPLISTWGSRPPPGQGYVMALFPKGKVEEALQFVAHAAEQQVHVLHTNKAEVSSPLASQIVQFAGWPSSVEKSLAGLCYSVELSGDESLEQPLQAKAESLGGHCTSNGDAGELFRHLGIDG